MVPFEIENFLGLHGSENAYTTQLLEDFYFLVEHEHYHQALNVYHLLFMTVVYQTVLKAREWRKQKFEDATILVSHRDLKRAHMLETTLAFDFSKIPESSFMNYLKLFDADKILIGDCKKLVKDRNERSHANGNYLTNAYVFETTITDYDRVLGRIHTLYRDFLEEVLGDYLRDLGNDLDMTRDDLELYLISPQKLSLSDLHCLLGMCEEGGMHNIKQILIDEYGLEEEDDT